MKSAPKRGKYRTRDYTRVLRPQKDLRAFFAPLTIVIGLLAVVSVVVSGGTVGVGGVMPEYETTAVPPPPENLSLSTLMLSRTLCEATSSVEHLLCTSGSLSLPASRPIQLPKNRLTPVSAPPFLPHPPSLLRAYPQGDPNYSLLHSEDTYWQLATSMGGFPIKHFYKNGLSIRPHSGAFSSWHARECVMSRIHSLRVIFSRLIMNGWGSIQ